MVIVKQHLVQIDQIDGPTEYASWILTAIDSHGGRHGILSVRQRILAGNFSGDTTPNKVWGCNPVKDDRSDFTRGCIPRNSCFRLRRSVFRALHSVQNPRSANISARGVSGLGVWSSPNSLSTLVAASMESECSVDTPARDGVRFRISELSLLSELSHHDRFLMKMYHSLYRGTSLMRNTHQKD